MIDMSGELPSSTDDGLRQDLVREVADMGWFIRFAPGDDAVPPIVWAPSLPDAGSSVAHQKGSAPALWAGVRDRVEALRARRRDVYTYDEKIHGYALAAPLAADDVADLETWLGIPLPVDYRDFLMHVGAGGAGPEFGVLQVYRTDANTWKWHGQYRPVEPALVVQPFSTLRADDETRLRMHGAPPFEENFADPEDFQREFDAWAERANDGVGSSERTAGAICVANRGIALWEFLIVTGPAAGTIWHCWADRGGDADLEPGFDRDGNPLTFARWYLDWLAQAETSG